jgi:myo-inositol-1(or 4)-monophosphatase
MVPTPVQPDPTELLELAVAVARQAGEEAVRQRREGIAGLATKSTATDLVTAADRAVERLIRDLIRVHRPGDSILGEELGAIGGGKDTAAGSAVVWVVDPIDGTVNYVYDLPHYAVSIAAQVRGVSVAGVVRNPVSGEEWRAWRGGGAWRGDCRLSASTASRLDRALVSTGFAYAAGRRAHQAHVLAQVLPRVRDIRRFGAASIDLCHAAEGRVDAYFEQGLNAWDHAAGGLVAEEAGLRVTGLRGAPPGPDLVLAAPQGLYDQLHDLLVSLDADRGP